MPEYPTVTMSPNKTEHDILFLPTNKSLAFITLLVIGPVKVVSTIARLYTK